MPKINVKNDVAPSTPPTGYTSIYAKTDKFVYIKQDNGTEYNITAQPATAAPVTQTPDQSNNAGVAVTYSKSDHVHNIPTAAASSVSTSTLNTQGSASSFARADHTHAVTIPNNGVTATTPTTTTSTSYVALDSMTTLPAAGTYFVTFTAETVNSGNGAIRNSFSIFIGGVQAIETERNVGTSGGANTVVSICTIVTVNGSQSIAVQWKVAGGTGTTNNRGMCILKLA